MTTTIKTVTERSVVITMPIDDAKLFASDILKELNAGPLAKESLPMVVRERIKRLETMANYINNVIDSEP